MFKSKFYEDYIIGDIRDTIGRTVTETDIDVQMIPISDSFYSSNPQESMDRNAFDLITINTHHFGLCMENGGGYPGYA